MPEAVIVDVVRTPSGRGKPGGALSGVHPTDLLAEVLASLVERNRLDPGTVDDVIGGCVSQAGEQSYNVARNALLGAGFPDTGPGTTIDRQCGSSQQATMFAAQGVMTGQYDIAIACGVESMSRVPLGSSTLGLDPYGERVAARYPDGLVGQGVSAELIAHQWGFGREALDAFSERSHRLAAAATERGDFAGDMVTVGGVSRDETIREGTTLAGLAGLGPAFRTDQLAARFPQLDWRITAGNSSPLTDGASAALIMSAERAAALGLVPRARFLGFAVTGSDPILMLTGVIPATRKVLDRASLTIEVMDAYEVNEAFACVPLLWQQELGADPEKLNPWGGAIALGHALGSSGTRLLATLVGFLESSGGRYGLQAMCEGGGMANATVIERM
jgi:acetyl-CoA acyltransferase